jgi:putative lipoic acid-binding regulatory protein
MSETPDTPPLEYPALYTFRVIGQRSAALRANVRRHVQAVVGLLPDEAITERPSSGGAWLAVHVTCLLATEAQRQDVYARFHADPLIKLAL